VAIVSGGAIRAVSVPVGMVRDKFSDLFRCHRAIANKQSIGNVERSYRQWCLILVEEFGDRHFENAPNPISLFPDGFHHHNIFTRFSCQLEGEFAGA
jgi:hypothetical protein